MRLRGPFLAITGALLAFAAWQDAAAEYWLTVGPEKAPSLLRSDKRIELAANDAALLTEPEQERGFWQAVAATARSVLRTEALDAAAVRQRGLASYALEQEGLAAHLRLAQRVSRRDVPTQVSLLELAVRADDYHRSFMHLDTILTTEPAAGTQFFAPMAILLADPEARRMLARYGKRRWFGDFAAMAVKETENPADLAALLIASDAALPDTRDTLLPRLLDRLVETGQYPIARDLSMRFGAAKRTTLDDFAISNSTAEPRLAPLTWRLAASETVQTAVLPQGTLEVELRPGTVVPVAERVTSLAPGSYALEQKVDRDDGNGTLFVAWELRCRRGDRSELAWRQPLPMSTTGVHYRSLVRLPRDCPLQQWRLSALADDTQSNVVFRVAELRIGTADR